MKVKNPLEFLMGVMFTVIPILLLLEIYLKVFSKFYEILAGVPPEFGLLFAFLYGIFLIWRSLR